MGIQRKGTTFRPSTIHVVGVAIILIFLLGPCMAAIKCEGKSSWPELVGLDGRVAAVIIQMENYPVKPFIVKVGTIVTEEFRCDRVLVWIRSYGRVARTPIIG